VFTNLSHRIERRQFHSCWAKARAKAGLDDGISMQFRDTGNNSRQWVLEYYGDLNHVQHHLRHSDPRTTRTAYVGEPLDIMEDSAEAIASGL
jgi:integrase